MTTTPVPVPPAATWVPAGKREAPHLAALLERGEPVRQMAHGTYAKRKGLLILTSQRVLFMRDRWNGAMAQEFHLAAVSSITLHESAGHNRVVIECSGVTSEITGVSAEQGERLVHEAQRILSYVRSPISAPKPQLRLPPKPKVAGPRPATVEEPATALMAHLRELAQLRQDGLLDDYEFAVAKSKLLN